MAYTLKSDDSGYHLKLTRIGRQLLAQGQLTFASYQVGDSEVDYQATDATSTDYLNLRILRPVDAQVDLKYPVPVTVGAGSLAPLTAPVSQQVPVRNAAPVRGPFLLNQAGTRTAFNTQLPTPGGAITFIKAAVHVTSSGTNVVRADAAISSTLVGDWLLVHWLNPAWTTPVAPLTPTYDLNPAHAGVYLLYRILAISGSDITLDRPTPAASSQRAPSPAFVYPGGEAIEQVYGPADAVADWNEDTLSFAATPPIASADVDVWNLSIVYGEEVIGGANFPWGGYPSNAYVGTRRYLGYTNTLAPLAVLHYSNNVVHNLYGETLSPVGFTLTLPTVLWWGEATGAGGLTLTALSKAELTTGGGPGSGLKYYPLVDSNQRVVGRLYATLKVVTLDDVELVAALSAKSNRNWTLPPFSYVSTPTTQTGAVSTQDARTLHVTYALETDSTDTVGYGLLSGVPCQYVSSTAASLANLAYLEFKLNASQLQHLQDETTRTAAAGAGYTAQRLVILFQETQSGHSPAADTWVRLDATQWLTPSVAAGAPIRRDAVGKLYQIAGDALRQAQQTAMTTSAYYRLPVGSAAEGLTFGEETLLLATIATTIEALVFRSSFLLSLAEGQYVSSVNPTWQSGQPVAITEFGIYDANANLVASGKLTDPLVKSSQEPQFIDASLDF